jgi:hypothetical protein
LATARDGSAEVAIHVVRAAKGGENNALSHLAADAQILENAEQPLLARVIEGQWIAPDTFAIVTERVSGETLGQLIERGEHFSNPRIAMLLQEVSGALDWAREHGVVHRGITPDTVVFERDTDRMRLTFTPTPVPMSGIPDVCTDARTIAKLAWTMMTGERYAEGESPRSLGEVCPNLATRVIESTDKMLRCKDHVDTPDVPAYLAVLGAGDVMKQAEVELAAMKEEYDEEHRRELQKCELHRQETEQRAAEQLALLAGEREELERQIADERAAIAAERAQFEQLMEERKQRLAAVRAELDEQRVELERRLAELEAYRIDVEKLREDAISARDEAKLAAANAATAFSTASAAAAAAEKKAASDKTANEKTPSDKRANQKTPSDPSKDRNVAPVAAVPLVTNPYEKPIKLPKPPRTPKWQKMPTVDLDATDIDAATVNSRRPGWMIPAGVAVLALILIAVVFSITHRTAAADRVRIGNSTVVPATPAAPSAVVPRGGFLTQSAGGNVAPSIRTSPLVDSTTAADAGFAAPSDLVTRGDPTPAPTMPASSPTRENVVREPSVSASRPPDPPPITNGASPAPSDVGATTVPIVTPPAAPLPQPIRPTVNVNAQAAARAAQARADSEAARRRIQAITDSLNSPSSMWNKPRPPRPDSTRHR